MREIYYKQLLLELLHLTFLNFGVVKKIILTLKNNIEIVSAGKIKSIKSELNKEGILAKIKCMQYVAKDIGNFVSF